jgi:hypothetical protein
MKKNKRYWKKKPKSLTLEERKKRYKELMRSIFPEYFVDEHDDTKKNNSKKD